VSFPILRILLSFYLQSEPNLAVIYRQIGNER
jgi:hypothetical protein